MADTKISALPASTTPLAGTEELPIVQSGVTRKVSVANLTAGRAISATQLTLTTGNLIVASGQGIDFSATPGTGTSELFDDYEEGEWTCAVVGQTATRTGYYTKIGNVVHVTVDFACDTNATGTTSSSPISGLPFSASPSQVLSMWVRSADAVSGGSSAPTLTAGSPLVVQTSGTSLVIRPTASTQVNPYYFEDMFNSGSQFIITGSYRV